MSPDSSGISSPLIAIKKELKKIGILTREAVWQVGSKKEKGIYDAQVAVLKIRVPPPRKHDLVALAKVVGLLEECDKNTIEYLRRLTVYYIEARYPEEKAELSAKCTGEHTRDIIKQAGEVFQWLASELS